MINYKVDVDISDFYHIVKTRKWKLGNYNKHFCTIFVEGKDPDDAAGKVLHNLINIILGQSDDVDAYLSCRRLRRYMRILRIRSA
jgi:hypothetical protein